MSDTNLHSFIGPDDNGRTVDLGDVAVDPTKIASSAKCTRGVKGLTVTARRAQGGKDAVADTNDRAEDVSVTVEEAEPQGQFVGLVKGGARRIHYCFPRILSHGKVCDFIYDDWSDQCHDATKGCSLAARMADGSPVRVIALKTKPSLVETDGFGPYSFPWWQPLNQRIPFTENYYVVGSAFDVLRRWGLFRAQANG